MTNKKEIKNGLFELTVKAVILNEEGKVLLIRRSKTDPLNPGKLDLVGGYINDKEIAEDALKREIKEETNLDVEVGPLLGIVDFKNNGKIVNGKGLRYLAYSKGGEVKVDENEHSGFEWLSLDEAINKLEDSGYEKCKRQNIIKVKEYLELQKSMDGWKRCMADFENYKKRQAEAQKDLIKYSTESIVYQILPVLDNFHSSTDHIPEDQKENPWVTGIMYIQKQLEDVLKDNGVEEIEVKEGDEFSPHKHEAIDHETQNMEHGTRESESTNKITKVLSKGYKLGDKVIRAARVVVK